MNTKDFFYEFPEAAYLIAVVLAVAALYAYLAWQRRDFLQRFAVEAVLKRVVANRSALSYALKVIFICTAWILASLALMDPKGNARYPDELLAELNEKKQEPSLRFRPHEVAFVLDTSRSMDVKDMRTGQSRLDFGKDIIDEMIRGLNGETISLYTFTGEGNKVVPSTLDYVYGRILLKHLNSNDEGRGGTSLKGAIQKVMQDFSNLPSDTLKTIVLISDGEDLQYTDLSQGEKQGYLDNLLAVLGNVKGQNLRIFSVGVGTQKGGVIPKVTYEGKEVRSAMDDQLLKALADKGRGKYYSGNQYSTKAISEAIIKAMGADNPYKPLVETQSNRNSQPNRNDFIYDRYFQYYLASAMVLLALSLLLPDRWQRRKP